MNLSELKAPFDPAKVSWRVGSTTQDKTRGLALAYIDARDVQDRLDAVCGPENWANRYLLLGATTICEIGIKVREDTPALQGEWIWKADGAGATDVEGEKGALSDAFKRAAVKWGVGRYLYDLDSPWVALEAAGRSYKIKDSELARLQALLAGKRELASERKEREKKSDAKEWAASQVELVMEMNAAQLHAWEVKMTPALERMKTAAPDSYEWLEAKLAIRREQVRKAA